MKKGIGFLLSLSVFLLISISSQATHLRAGEVVAVRQGCNSFTYEFRIILYIDLEGVEPGGGEIDFGDGNTQSLEVGNPNEFRDLGEQIGEAVFIVRYTYAGPGVFKVAFREFNRNDGIVNMDNSVNTPLYLETEVQISPLICNDSPKFLNAPIDKACVGVAYFHNPGAIDLNGDSLSYEFVIPKQDVDTEVLNYIFPDEYDKFNYNAQNEDMTDVASFTIDPLTGTVTWDAPGGTGEYNFAFIVREWRKTGNEWQPVGFITRDMQVIVEDCDNERPELIIPPDTCVRAGTLLESEIFAQDIDGDPILITTFGLVYEIFPNPATFEPNPPEYMPTPAKMDFSWQTDCRHINSNPYQINFKALDDPPVGAGAKLADFATWFVTVVGPPPEGLGVTQTGKRQIELSWDNYMCDNAIDMQIWRKVDSYDFTPGNCELGIPENSDYELIDVIDARETNYIDNYNLELGILYCYRLVATFREPNYMESVVSEEICLMPEDINDFNSLMTNVSVNTTDENNGEIFVRWTSPFDINPLINPPPYTYDVFRGIGLNSAPNLQIATGQSDSTIVDSSLNTLDNSYNYQVIAYDGNGERVDTTLIATSVWIDPVPLKGAMEVIWEANTPWTNFSQERPYHLIYRNNANPSDPDEMVLIDSVNVFQSGFVYEDNGQFNGDDKLDENTEYCYLVTTRGSYGNDKIAEPLINSSQIACAQPFDTIPPCTPLELSILNLNLDGVCEDLSDKSCDFEDFSNSLAWAFDEDPECGEDIRSFNIYFSSTGSEEDFVLIDNVRDTFYVHRNLESYAGCYRIASVDRSGNESELTEMVCNDNCPAYFLPNVFTPNDDGVNDKFQAFYQTPWNQENPFEYCPRFVENVKFEVYSRWGNEVYSYESGGENSILINWDGVSNSGRLVSAGVYYYLVTVEFNMLDPSQRQQQYKGWIKIDRGN